MIPAGVSFGRSLNGLKQAAEREELVESFASPLP